jgi:hypothetical protein
MPTLEFPFHHDKTDRFAANTEQSADTESYEALHRHPLR